MMTTKRRSVFAAAAVLLASGAALAQASAPAPAARDPGRPSQAAIDAAQAERRQAQAAGGASLQAQVETRLKARFDAADQAHRGFLTRAEARAGGFGWIADHFDAIDTRHAGQVSFDDVRSYLATPRTDR